MKLKFYQINYQRRKVTEITVDNDANWHRVVSVADNMLQAIVEANDGTCGPDYIVEIKGIQFAFDYSIEEKRTLVPVQILYR